jgi:glycosyltransferase involved in cell wall biosynthesis
MCHMFAYHGLPRDPLHAVWGVERNGAVPTTVTQLSPRQAETLLPMTDANVGRQRLLLVVPTLCGGGAERVMCTLAHNLDRSRYEVSLAVFDMREAAYRHLIPEDVPLYDLGAARVRFGIPGLLKLIRAQHPAAILTTLDHLNVLLALCRPVIPSNIALIARAGFLASGRAFDVPSIRVFGAFYRVGYRLVDRVICQSDAMREDLALRFGVPADKMVTIRNPLDVDTVREQARAPCAVAVPKRSESVIQFVAVGRLVRVKGFDILIRALAECSDIPFFLTLIGDGPERESLLNLARELNVSDRICLLPFQRNPFSYMSSSDALILSSRHEGLPNVVLEAMACGTPVIATPAVGGLREALRDRPECVIANEISSHSLAAAIRNWSLSERTRVPPTAVEGFAADRIARLYANVIAEAIQSRVTP